MKNVRLIAVAVLAVFVTAPASAQQTATTPAPAAQATPAPAPQAAAPAAPDAKTMGAAKEVVKLMNVGRNLNAMLDLETKTILPMVERANPSTSQNSAKIQDIITSVIQDMQKSFMSHIDEIENNYATLYAEEYSYDELQQLIVFYKSPVGQKMLNNMPAIMQKAAAKNQGIIIQAMKESMQNLRDKLKANGLNVPAGMGI